MYNQAPGIDPNLQMTLLAVFAGMQLVMLAIAIITIVATWRLFTKAGKPGWASIIPIYNFIILLEIVGKPAWWVILLFIPIVNIVIGIMITHRLSLAFGRGIGTTLGLLFLTPIFMLILAFGKSTYLGAPQD